MASYELTRKQPALRRAGSGACPASRRRRADFNGLHSRKYDDEVQFYAFDILVERRRRSPQASIASAQEQPRRLLARRVNGIFLANFEQGEIGPDLFRHACLMGLEGFVSKHKDRPYRAGRSSHWVKVRIEAGERHLVADKGLAAQVLNDRPIDRQTIRAQAQNGMKRASKLHSQLNRRQSRDFSSTI